MYATISIFMGLKIGGKGEAGLRIIRNAFETVLIFMVLELPRTDAVGSGITKNEATSMYFHSFGNGQEGGGWVQNHKKCIGLSS